MESPASQDNIETLAQEIISRSETATRNAIRKLKPGTFHGESSFDVPGGDIITLKTAVTVDTKDGSILIDFDGSSGPSPYGINVVMNYTHAYSTFAIRSCLNPELPNNFGSLAPIRIKAPEGCIVNCKYPSPVNARHARRRRPDHQFQHAHQKRMAAQRGGQPHQPGAGRAGGGEPGMAGRFLINGEPVSNARKLVMQPADEVTLDTPGGGGYGRAVSLRRAAE